MLLINLSYITIEKNWERHELNQGLLKEKQELYPLCPIWVLNEMFEQLLLVKPNLNFYQIMSDVNFLSDIFVVCKVAVEDEDHVLHVPFQVTIH